MSKHIKAGPIAWISDESLWRLAGGGNDSKGTVPVHAKRSGVSKYALYCAVRPITKEHVRLAGGIVHGDGNVFFTNLDQLNQAVLHALESEATQ